MEFIIIGMVTIIILMISMPGTGKFWHNHDWVATQHASHPSMYSSKKEVHYQVEQCKKDCTAFRVRSWTARVDDGV